MSLLIFLKFFGRNFFVFYFLIFIFFLKNLPAGVLFTHTLYFFNLILTNDNFLI